MQTGRLQRLEGFLRSVTPALALRLAQAIEADRVSGGALPHDAIMGALRPRLREAHQRLARIAPPQRLVCAAFEDLLVGARLRKQRGRIARSSIAPVWTWLTTGLLKPEELEWLNKIRDRLLSSGAEYADREVAAFQQAAAAALLAQVPSGEANDPRNGAAAKILGGIEVALDAHDMARMLEIGPQVLKMQREFPQPMHTLHETDIVSIRETWERIVEEHPDCAAYVAFMILGRLERPWEVLRLAGALSRKLDDVLVSRTDAGFVGDLLLSDLEDCVARLAAMRGDQMEPNAVLANVETFARTSTGMVRELGIKRDGIWGKRMMTARAGMADAMERFLGRATKEIVATLPMTRKGGFGLRAVGQMPDFTKRLDPQKAKRAIDLATLIAGSRPHAMAGAFAGQLSEIEEPVAHRLRHFTTEMFDELRKLDPAQRVQADALIEHATRLSTILLGAEEGELVRRRVAAAQPDTAAETLVA